MSTPLTAAETVAIARHAQRPNIDDYIAALFPHFFPMQGDRLCGEDKAILGGVGLFHGQPVTVIGTRKAKTLQENLKGNFGMPSPEGYRKAQRLMRQAEKFGRPVITFIDTPGAYPGLQAEERGQGEAIARNLMEMSRLRVPILAIITFIDTSGAYPGLQAEERGQGEAIARNLMEMSRLTVPVIAIVTGEGNSGGALALGIANRVLMLENAVYAILSPEGFASILWKDASRSAEACELMKMTAPDLKALGIIDEIIPEPAGGAHLAPEVTFLEVERAIARNLEQLKGQKGPALAAERYQKFRKMGS